MGHALIGCNLARVLRFQMMPVILKLCFFYLITTSNCPIMACRYCISTLFMINYSVSHILVLFPKPLRHGVLHTTLSGCPVSSCPSTHPPTCRSVCLCLCLSFCLSACLSVCLSERAFCENTESKIFHFVAC